MKPQSTPRLRSSAATKSRILDAAAAEFAHYGIDGARVDRIASKASANKQLIYAYFGGKEALFAEVVIQRLVARNGALGFNANDIPTFLGKLFDHFVDDDTDVRLLSWEGLNFAGGAIDAAARRRKEYRQTIAAIEEAQRRGVISGEFKATHLIFALYSMVSWWFAVPQVATLILGVDPASKKVLANYRTTAMEIAARILRP
jgi:AcrR family transcriptional regulator